MHNIYGIVHAAIGHYLGTAMQQHKPEQHAWVKAQYDAIVSRLAEHLHAEVYLQERLTQQAVQQLHKLLYPEGHIGYQNDPNGNPVAYLLPGQYKIFPNFVIDTVGNRLPCTVEPRDVGTAMDALFERLNSALAGPAEGRKDAILWFGLDFADAHPFADANGRLAVMLIDTLLLKYGFEPMRINLHKLRDTKGLYDVVIASRKQRNLRHVYEYIERNNRNNA